MSAWFVLPALVCYEWLRDRRLREELEAQEALFPRAPALPFGAEEAALAAGLLGVVLLASPIRTHPEKWGQARLTDKACLSPNPPAGRRLNV